MSTDLYLVCKSHIPNIKSSEVGHNLSFLPEIRESIAHRTELFEMVETMMENGQWPDDANLCSYHTLMFFYNHPECDLGIVDEYGRIYSIEEEAVEEPIGVKTPLGTLISTSSSSAVVGAIRLVVINPTPELKRAIGLLGDG